MKFSQIISRIECEISIQYLPGAIRWCDENHSNAWSNAIDRFDKALSIAIERLDHKLAEIEGDYYCATIVDLLSKYKNFKKMDETSAFLKSITASGMSNSISLKQE